MRFRTEPFFAWAGHEVAKERTASALLRARNRVAATKKSRKKARRRFDGVLIGAKVDLAVRPGQSGARTAELLGN